jgi:hypothetical protein
MSLHHFTHQAIDGRWHAVYRTPGCGSLTSVGDAPCQNAAQELANRANRDQARKADTTPADLYERKIPKGLYEDAEAA